MREILVCYAVLLPLMNGLGWILLLTAEWPDTSLGSTLFGFLLALNLLATIATVIIVVALLGDLLRNSPEDAE